MNWFGRIALGALLSTLLTLFAHSAARHVIGCSIFHSGVSKTIDSSKLLSENFNVLPIPSDALTSSIWMIAGANRVNLRQELSKQTLDALIEVATTASQSDPDNAFWLQMLAVFYDVANRPQEAADSWELASRRISWNDYQSARLLQLREQLQAEFGSHQAWQSSRLFYTRSEACAVAIERYAGQTITTSGFKTKSDLDRRLVCLRNGRLIRNGSRSLKIGQYGVNIIEISSYRSRNLIASTPKKLIVSRFAFIDNLRSAGMTDTLEEVRRTFEDNEGWLALTNQTDPEVQNWWRSFLATLAIAAPGGLLIGGLACFGVWALAALFDRIPALQVVFRVPTAPILGVIVGFLIYTLIQSWLLSILVVLSMSFAGYSPPAERTHPPKDLGPLFRLSCAILGTIFGALIACFVGGLSAPVVEVFPALGISSDYFAGATLPLMLAGIVVCLALVVATLYAFVVRVKTADVILKVFRQFGILGGFICLTLAALSTPAAMAYDRSVEPTMSKVLQNEPNYYVLQ